MNTPNDDSRSITQPLEESPILQATTNAPLAYSTQLSPNASYGGASVFQQGFEPIPVDPANGGGE